MRHLLTFLLLFLPLSSMKAQIDADRVVMMGRSALSVDDYLTAIHYFNQAIEAKPFLSRPYYYRAYAKFTLDDFSGALDDCSKSIALNPYIYEVYELRGLCLIRMSRFKDAAADYTQVLRYQPDSQSARYNRSLCYLEADSLAAAEADLDFLLRKWPNFSRALLIKSQVAFEKHDTLSGIAMLDTLLQKNPREADAWRFKGLYAMEKEQYALADSFLSEALHYQPQRYDLFVARAEARHALDRFALALADYDQAITLVPEHFVAHYNRALLRAFTGDYNRAIDDFNFVLSKEPDNTLARYNRAQLLARTGNHRAAIADYTIILRAYPDFMQGYLARAESRRKVGDVKGALHDETLVARRHLDIAFAKNTRRPSKRVRRRSEHALEQYQQLIVDEPDTTRHLFGTVLGKVQNEPTDNHPIPMYALAILPVNTKGYHASAFLPEMNALRPINTPERRLYFTSEIAKSDMSATEHDAQRLALVQQQLGEAQQALLQSAVQAARYDYPSAIAAATRALSLDTLSVLPLLQRAAVLSRAAVATTDPAVRKEQTTLALSDLRRAMARAPKQALVAYGQGCLFQQLSDTTAAIQAYTRAIELDPRLPEAYFNRALIFVQQGERERATTDLSRAGQLGLYRAYAVMKQMQK